MRAQTKARSFHFFARRRGGVVQVQTERFFFVIDPPPRRFAPPLLARRGNRPARLSARYVSALSQEVRSMK